jgi:hypothetical protein
MRSYNLGNIEIMDRDLSYRDNKINYHPTIKGINRFSYGMSLDLIKQYGDNWRLPTIEEMKFLQEYYNLGILNFSKDAYWTSDIIKDSNGLPYDQNQYAYYLSTRRYGGIPKDQRLSVRLIRDI